MLEHETDASRLGGPAGHVLAVEQDLACIRLLEPRDHAEQGGLPASARAEECREGAGRHVDGDAVEGREGAEVLHDLTRLDHCVPSLGFSRVIRSRVAMARSARTTAAA